jgi:hypothetical protein
VADAERGYTDAERLDWVDEPGSTRFVVRNQQTGEWYVSDALHLFDDNPTLYGHGPTLRAAIDAAMRRAEGEGKP